MQSHGAAADRLRVSFRPLREVPDLEATWRDVQARSTSSFFLSWDWIGTWLANLADPRTVHVMLVHDDAQVVGAALLSKATRRVGRLPVCEAWYLHASGDKAYDGLCIEHNGILADTRFADDVRAAIVKGWRGATGRAAELHLPGLYGDGWPAELGSGLTQVSETKRSAGVDLQAVREAKLDFTPLLSSHSRRFVRRSIKEYEAVVGPMAVDEAATLEQATAFLAELVRLHESTWHSRGQAGAFAEPRIRRFHDQLLARSFSRGSVQLLRVRAGERAIGYLYSFIRNKRLYVYQSGFDYGVLEKHGRPGLVSHTLAIQHNAGRGHDYYDLLAGESQYKASVSTVQEPMTWTVWQKPALRFKLEAWAKTTARRYLKAKKRSDADNAATPAEESAAPPPLRHASVEAP